ncbi:flagellar basal body P-ring protein FlgI [Lignipirellula cremea]|uniref:flagellar basal body P-ring protein FlgI n=1 Tax=Lignipirellula cremea TaxID=2528010 RepID=UPI001E62A8AD|nr:flagellar basal body P-ring protein FlgI [Lignipirellula cremea]
MVLTSVIMGCTSPLFDFRPDKTEIEPFVKDASRGETTFVGDLAGPWGVNWLKVESIALVTNLRNTGSDPPPSPQRSRLVGEMKQHDVEHPDDVLALPSTSMVIVTAYLPPGVEKDDPLDLEVTTRSRSETTSLASGYLMFSRLRQIEVMGNALQTGHEAAQAEGPILVDSIFEGEEDKSFLTRGMVLGGGRAMQNRPLGLSIRDGNHSIKTSTLIGSAVNKRFYLKGGVGGHRGVATPKTNRFIELLIPPQYKHNIGRYLRVVANIPVRDTPSAMVKRLGLLERQLLEPTTAAAAALRLEAIGAEAEPTLLKGLESEFFECRFYAAEALAYLRRVEAVPALSEAAASKPQFRWHALAALTVMHDIEAVEALAELMSNPSAETRYGAFRALYTRNPQDPMVEGHLLDGKFNLHVAPSLGEPMVHFARTRRAEVVVFGREATVRPTEFLYAGPHIMITPLGPGRLKISRFSPGQSDLRLECNDRVPDMIAGIVKAGGGYGEVLAAMRTAEKEGLFAGRVAVNATPMPGRNYYASASEADGSERTASPLPELYQTRSSQSEQEIRETMADQIEYEEEEPEPKRGFFDKVSGWFMPE